MKIFIPSKGRHSYKQARSMLLFDNFGVEYTIVIEKEEEIFYSNAFPKAELLILPESGRGIGYSRDFLLRKARAEGHDWIWIFDDDVKNFGKKVGKRIVKMAPAEFFRETDRILKEELPNHKIGIAGALYSIHTIHAQVSHSINRRFWSNILINTKTGIDYDPSLRVWEDMDFFINHLSNGWKSLCFNQFCVEMEIGGFHNGTRRQEGGCGPDYLKGAKIKYSAIIAKRYPEYLKVYRDKNGKLQSRIFYKKFK